MYKYRMYKCPHAELTVKKIYICAIYAYTLNDVV